MTLQGMWVSVNLDANQQVVEQYAEILQEFEDIHNGHEDKGELDVRGWYMVLVKWLKKMSQPRKTK